MKNRILLFLLVFSIISGIGCVSINAAENDMSTYYICHYSSEAPMLYLITEAVAGEIDNFEFTDKNNEKLSADTNGKTGDNATGEDSINYTVVLLEASQSAYEQLEKIVENDSRLLPYGAVTIQ